MTRDSGDGVIEEKRSARTTSPPASPSSLAGWGEKGYIRIARFANEPCGTDPTPGDGDGCSGGPATIQVCGLCGLLSDSSFPTGATAL